MLLFESEVGWNGSIWLPEGEKGWGWCWFVGEMGRMLELQGGKIGPTNDDFPSLPSKRVEVNLTATYGSCFGWSFVNVLRSTVGGVKHLSSCLLDVFPVSECYKAELGKVELRSAVDCYAMEAEQFLSKELLVAPALATLSMAMANSLKMKEWVKLQLGFFPQRGGSSFSWADCWAGIEAQRGAKQS
jgi:hypothetical protein